MVIIDDSPSVTAMHPYNTIKVKEWTCDMLQDRELIDVCEVLQQLRFTTDVPSSLGEVTELVYSYRDDVI